MTHNLSIGSIVSDVYDNGKKINKGHYKGHFDINIWGNLRIFCIKNSPWSLTKLRVVNVKKPKMNSLCWNEWMNQDYIIKRMRYHFISYNIRFPLPSAFFCSLVRVLVELIVDSKNKREILLVTGRAKQFLAKLCKLTGYWITRLGGCIWRTFVQFWRWRQW